MSILTRLRAQARYNVLTPIFLLSLGAASPALAATVVIDTPTEDVEILTDDSLINRSDITSNNNQAIYAAEDIGSITNEANANIFGGSSSAIYLAGSADSITNAGVISSTALYGIYMDGGLGEFTNSGTIEGYAAALYVDKDLDYFTNTNEIFSSAGTAVSIGGEVESFTNSGNIEGNETGVKIGGEVGVFANSGEIIGNLKGVSFDNYVERFANSGTITGDMTGVNFDKGAGTVVNNGEIDSEILAIRSKDEVQAFVNDIDGLIKSDGDGVEIANRAGQVVNHGMIDTEDTGIYIDGSLGDFYNSGTISSDSQGLFVGLDTGTFFNSGRIESTGNNAVSLSEFTQIIVNTNEIIADNKGFNLGSAGDFSNSGVITSDHSDGVDVQEGIGTFYNSNTINAAETGLEVGEDVGAFRNTGIIMAGTHGLAIGGDLKNFRNSGTISGGVAGIKVEGAVSDFHNTGTITGAIGATFLSGGADIKNSGLIEGTGGMAVDLNGDNNRLAIGTGARFLGFVDFGGGANTYLDATDFHGSTIIGDQGATLTMGNVDAGDNYYYQTATEIHIVSGGFVNSAPQPVSNLVTGLGELLTTKLATADVISNPDEFVLYYTGKAMSPAEMATREAVATKDNNTAYWADAIGGGGRNPTAGANDVYGALVAGAHTVLSDDLTLGLMGGFAHTTLDIGSGSQMIDATLGIVGAYGSYEINGIHTDFSLLGGLSGNDSDRTILIGDDTETASASYGGWFIAPTVGAYVPVMTTDTTDITFGGKLGYLAGGFAGYTEDGSNNDLIVDAQSYGIVTALLEMRAESRVSDMVTLNGSLGVFAQHQSGTAAVSFADTGIDLIAPDAPGASGGLKVGVGAEVALSDAFAINAGVTGNWRTSGTAAVSANLGAGGKF